MSDATIIPTYLKSLRLPAIAGCYRTLAEQARREGLSHEAYLEALLQEELSQRRTRRIASLLKGARFPVMKSLDGFRFNEVPSLNQEQVRELGRTHYVAAKESVILCGNSGMGKTHLAIALGILACEAGYRARFTTAAALANELLAAREDRTLHRLEKQWLKVDLAIVDEVGYVPFDPVTAQLLFQFFAARYERGSTLITTNLEFAQWTEVFGDERLTVALLDRITHRSHILVMNGESYRFKQSKRQKDGMPTDDE